MEKHRAVVADVAAAVKSFYDRNEPFRIYHGSTNSTRTLNFKRNQIVDTSSLNHVLAVNVAAKTVTVEPNVPMDQLLAATLRHGLLPPVVMEFPNITVGGGFSGTSGESSSFRYGFFDRTVNWIETVLANGEIVTASPSDKPDLFRGCAGSFGTIAVVTLLEIQLIDARKYVEISYLPVSTVAGAIQTLEDEIEDPANDYVDGILFSRDRGVIVKGCLRDTPSPGVRVQHFSRPHDEWFYLHAEKKLAESSPMTEAVPLEDYLFRYDRGAFWTGKYAFQYFSVPFNRLTRYLLDRFMHTRVMYHALHESGHAQQYIIQDLALPQSTVGGFIDFVDEEFGFYPLWLCPLHKNHAEISLHPHTSTPETRRGMLVNVGVWGPGPANRTAFVAANRKLELAVRDLSGMKWLYAHAYYTEDEFWEIYDKSWYDALRTKYHAAGLPSVFDKVKVDESKVKTNSWVWQIWPMSGIYGMAKMLLGSDYVLANDHRASKTMMVLTPGLLGAALAYWMR